MKRAVVVLSVLCCVAFALTAVAERPLDRVDSRAGLTQPAQWAEATFQWANAPGWEFTDVVFGIRDGNLVFAQFTAKAPGRPPVFNDRAHEVDYLIEDTHALPFPVEIKTGNGDKIWVDAFTVGIDARGRAIIDSASGAESDGRPILYKIGKIQTQPAEGQCGAATVRGSCTDFCYGSCEGDVSSGDPCVCGGTGGCTSGSAEWVCPTGECTGYCKFVSGNGCGCFSLEAEPRPKEPVGVSLDTN